MKSVRFLKQTVALASVALAAIVPSHAGILTGVDILNLTGVTESSMTDGNMSSSRSLLTTAGAIVTDVSLGSFSAANLTGIDILYVGMTSALSASQLSAINSFVAAGGGLVAVGTERAQFSPANDILANSFGLTGLGGDRLAKASATTPSSPIVTGPFGVATTYAPAATGAFSTVLPVGATTVWEGVDNNPIIVTLDVSGRAFFFADTNFMQNSFINNGNNSVIWGNAFAFTGKVDNRVPDSANTALLLGLTLMGLVGVRRRFSRR